MIEKTASLIGTCIGAVIGFFELNLSPLFVKIYTMPLPEEIKTLIMAFLGGIMAWCGGKLCSLITKKRKTK